VSEFRGIFSSGVSLTSLLDSRNYLIFVPTILLTSVLSNARMDDPGALLVWTISNLIALTIVFLLLEAGHRIARVLDRPVRVIGISLVGLALGILKTSMTLIALVSLGGSSLSISEIATRSLATAPLGLTLSFLVALIGVATDDYLAKREVLIGKRVAERSKGESDSSISNRLRSEMLEKIALEIATIRNRRVSEKNIGSLVKHAQELRDLAEQTVRPISHKIWDEQSRKINDYSIRQLLSLGVRSTPFSPAIFTLLVAPGLISWVVSYFGASQLFEKAILPLLTIFIAQLFASKLQVRNTALAILRFSLGVLLPAAISALLIHYSIIQSSALIVLTLFLTLAIWFTSNGILIAVFRAGLLARSNLDSELVGSFGKAAMSQISQAAISRFESRRIAQSLHSQVQNRLLTAAFQIESVDGLSPEKLDQQLLELEVLVRNLATPTDQASSEELEAVVMRVREQWLGFVEVILISGGALVPAISGELLEQLISEAVGNARRHGGANLVEIEAMQSPRGIRLIVRDNGTLNTGSAGLGFGLFEAASNGNFELKSTETGTKLELYL